MPPRWSWPQRVTVLLGLLALVIVPHLGTLPARANTPYTHAYSGDSVLQDIQDGTLTINGHAYAVDARVAQALQRYPQFYRAGTIGPDGFPDISYGQTVIHPDDTGQWMRYILKAAWDAQTDTATYPSEAERLQILAFAYGYLTHAAGDMWAHTVVNEFAHGVFPDAGEVLGEPEKAAIAIRHLILDAYIGDATAGFDANPNRQAVGNDLSDTSTPAVTIDSPHRWVYNTLVKPDAPTPASGRGPIIDAFLGLRASLQSTLGEEDPQPLQAALDEYQDTKEAFEELADDCNFGFGIEDPIEAGWDAATDLVECPAGLLELGITVAIDSFQAFLALSVETLALAADVVKDAYIGAWVADIDRGLEHWNEFGLATTRGLFDPQARRDTQNDECWTDGAESEADRASCEDGIGVVDVVFHEADPFINEYLLSMVGLPDLIGDIRAALQSLGDQLDFIEAAIDEFLGSVFDPLETAIDDIKEAVKTMVLDFVSWALGVDVEQFASFINHPTYWLNVTDVTIDLPALGPTTIHLFEEDSVERLDAYLGLTEEHHVGEWSPGDVGSTRLADDAHFSLDFAAFNNTVTTAKLLLLDEDALNQVMGDALVDDGIIKDVAGIITYPETSAGAPTNVMYHALSGNDPWLQSIDSDHAWRVNPLPIFCAPNSPECELPGLDPIERDPSHNAGNGQFPIWESCVLRPVFRDLFQDWENGDQNFPDLNDPVSADPSDTAPPTSTLTASGNIYIDANGTTFVGIGHALTISATDALFTDGQLAIQYRIYADGSTPGEWQTIGNGDTIAIPADAGDGVWKIDYRAEDPCHTFVDESGTGNDPLAPEDTQTATVVLDTTAPVIAISSPAAGSVFDTDDLSQISYTTDDGALGSGVAAHAVTFDGAPATDGQTLDMFFLDPGTHAVYVTAVDNLGNGSDATRTFEVHATAESLVTNVQRAYDLGLIEKQGVFQSMTAKMVSANDAHLRYQHPTEWNLMNAFIEELEAQTGKAIDPATATRFIAFAQDLIEMGY